MSYGILNFNDYPHTYLYGEYIRAMAVKGVIGDANSISILIEFDFVFNKSDKSLAKRNNNKKNEGKLISDTLLYLIVWSVNIKKKKKKIRSEWWYESF